MTGREQMRREPAGSAIFIRQCQLYLSAEERNGNGNGNGNDHIRERVVYTKDHERWANESVDLSNFPYQ